MAKPKQLQSISDLTPDIANVNKGSERGAYMLDWSLTNLGAGRSILADADGHVIAGNKTLEAAAEHQLPIRVVQTDGKELVVVQRTDLRLQGKGKEKEQARQLAVADNRASEVGYVADAEVLLSHVQSGVDLSPMFHEDELKALLDSLTPAIEPGGGGDEFDTTPEDGPTRCQVGDLWVIGGKHRLLCGDSTKAEDVARLMGNKQAEMIWTDPPYGVSVGDKNKYLNSIAPSNRVEENLTNDTLAEPELLKMLEAAFAGAMEHCLAGGAWYVAAPAGPLHVLFGQALKDLGVWHQTIQWVKNNATFSPMGVDYHWQAEPIFYGWKPGAAHRYYGGRTQTTVWAIDRPMASPDHPTMKPLELVSRAIVNSSKISEIAYDPFLGSGTTLIASHRENRTCYGIEIEPKYCDVILKRAEAEGLTAEKVVNG